MSYVIAGRHIRTEYLALATIFGTAGGAYLASGSGKSKSKSPPKPTKEDLGASSKDEEDFIKNFIAEAEKEDSAKH